MQITKKELDLYFEANYDSIILYIKKTFSKYRIFDEEPEFFFSELYLYIVDRLEEIDCEHTLKNYISTFIHNNSYWTNSQVRENERPAIRNRKVEYIQDQHENILDDNYTIEDDEKMDEYKAVVEMYYASLTSLEKKAVWEIYFLEGKTTITSFAEHIQMSRTVAYKFIKELKADIQSYYQKYKLRN